MLFHYNFYSTLCILRSLVEDLWADQNPNVSCNQSIYILYILFGCNTNLDQDSTKINGFKADQNPKRIRLWPKYPDPKKMPMPGSATLEVAALANVIVLCTLSIGFFTKPVSFSSFSFSFLILFINKIYELVWIFFGLIRKAAKKSYAFSGPATERMRGGGMGLATKKK